MEHRHRWWVQQHLDGGWQRLPKGYPRTKKGWRAGLDFADNKAGAIECMSELVYDGFPHPLRVVCEVCEESTVEHHPPLESEYAPPPVETMKWNGVGWYDT